MSRPIYRGSHFGSSGTTARQESGLEGQQQGERREGCWFPRKERSRESQIQERSARPSAGNNCRVSRLRIQNIDSFHKTHAVFSVANTPKWGSPPAISVFEQNVAFQKNQSAKLPFQRHSLPFESLSLLYLVKPLKYTITMKRAVIEFIGKTTRYRVLTFC